MTVRAGNEVSRWGFDMHQENGGNRWHWVWLNEGELFTPEKQRAWFDHPNTVEALQWAYDMVNTYQVSPAPGAVQGGHRGNFISGVYAMMITSSSFVPELKQQGIRFVTHPGPPGPGKNGYRFSGATSSTLSIVSSTQHPKEAWTFLRWLVYEKGLEFAEERGGIPYLIEGLQSGKYRAPWEAFATSILTISPATTTSMGSRKPTGCPHSRQRGTRLSGEKGMPASCSSRPRRRSTPGWSRSPSRSVRVLCRTASDQRRSGA